MNEPIHISASQIDLFRTCPRKWAWQYIGRIPRLASASLEFGKRVHAILEHYLKTGTAPDPQETWRFEGRPPIRYPGKTALQMINARLPLPGTALIEGGFDWASPTTPGVMYKGLIDVRFNRASSAVIIDHKTSIDPLKYGKKKEDLETDPQFILYARYALEVCPTAQRVRGIWNYGSTKSVAKAAHVTEIELTRAEVLDRFETYVETRACLMVHHRIQNTNPLTLEPNAAACELYGGCDHKARCNLTTAQRLGAIIMSASLMEDMLAAGGMAPATAQPTAPAGMQPPPHPQDAINPPEAVGPIPTQPAPSVNALLGANMPAPVSVGAPPVAPAGLPPAMVQPPVTTPPIAAPGVTLPAAVGVAPPAVAIGGAPSDPGAVTAGAVATIELFDRFVDLVTARVIAKLQLKR